MLIAIEGIHGAGKSELIKKIQKYYNGKIPVIITNWNSYETIHPLLYKYRIKDHMNDKYTYFLMQLADFAFRYYSIIESAIGDSQVLVVADRYVRTGWVRGIVRGINEEYVKSAYSFAKEPDVEILLDVDINISICRRRPTSDNIWKIGMGVFSSKTQFSELEYRKYLTISRNLYLKYAIENHSLIAKDHLPLDLWKALCQEINHKLLF